MIKAILFDFDGTLVDTNPLIIRSFTETFKVLFPEREFTQQELQDCIGPTLEETGRKYYPTNPNHLVEIYRRICWQYHDEMIEVYPGVEEMLKALKMMDLKLVIVTSKKRDMLLRGLEVTKLQNYFDWIVAVDDVTHPKPHQEPIERVLNYYGFQPDACLMVGDNSHDINSAKAAGVKSIAVGWALKGVNYLKSFDPDYIIEDGTKLLEIVKEEGV